MLLEILGGAMLSKALTKRDRLTNIQSVKKNNTERYAVLFEVKRGKGNGSYGVSHLSSDLNECLLWAENACKALLPFGFDNYNWSSKNNSENENVIMTYTCSGEDREIVYVVTIY